MGKSCRTSKPVTLADALVRANAYWDTRAGDNRMMAPRAKLCCEILGLHRELESLGPSDGTLILTHIGQSRSPKTVQAVYACFTRMLKLAGVSTEAWPKAKVPPRGKPKVVPTPHDVGVMLHWMEEEGWLPTAYLVHLLYETGMRIECEALTEGAWHPTQDGQSLEVTGKGGHTRIIPLGKPTALLLKDHMVGRHIRAVSYDSHLRIWREACAATGLCGVLPTPHSLRHLFARRAYVASGKDIVQVQRLLGHADPATTSTYIGTDMDQLEKTIREMGDE